MFEDIAKCVHIDNMGECTGENVKRKSSKTLVKVLGHISWVYVDVVNGGNSCFMRCLFSMYSIFEHFYFGFSCWFFILSNTKQNAIALFEMPDFANVLWVFNSEHPSPTQRTLSSKRNPNCSKLK